MKFGAKAVVMDEITFLVIPLLLIMSSKNTSYYNMGTNWHAFARTLVLHYYKQHEEKPSDDRDANFKYMKSRPGNRI